MATHNTEVREMFPEWGLRWQAACHTCYTVRWATSKAEAEWFAWYHALEGTWQDSPAWTLKQ